MSLKIYLMWSNGTVCMVVNRKNQRRLVVWATQDQTGTFYQFMLELESTDKTELMVIVGGGATVL